LLKQMPVCCILVIHKCTFIRCFRINKLVLICFSCEENEYVLIEKVVQYFDNVKVYTLENVEGSKFAFDSSNIIFCIMHIRKSYCNGYLKLSNAKPHFELMICFNPCLNWNIPYSNFFENKLSLSLSIMLTKSPHS
jgi:hypothetical protein